MSGSLAMAGVLFLGLAAALFRWPRIVQVKLRRHDRISESGFEAIQRRHAAMLGLLSGAIGLVTLSVALGL